MAALVIPLMPGTAPSPAAAQPEAAGKTYKDAEEALRAGALLYRERNFAAAQEPLEAALRLTDDVELRLKACRMLIASYRLLPETDRMLEVVEYIVANSEQEAAQTNIRGELLSFLRQRGKGDAAAERYEERLEEDPNDRAALFLLAEIYGELQKEPAKSAEIVERLITLDEEQGAEVSVRTRATLAQRYVEAKKFREGAELYEALAPQEEALAGRHWLEAAAAWQKARDGERALAAALASEQAGPDTRSEQLTHFWHARLGDVFLETGEPGRAIPHYEKAIATTTVEGYKKACREKLETAKSRVAPQG